MDKRVSSHEDRISYRGEASSFGGNEASADRDGLRQTSEVGRLRRVLLHRPGHELEHLTPRYLAELLFDEIPWLRGAQAEHDGFARALKERGTEALYIEDLLVDVLEDAEIRRRFVGDQLSFSLVVHDEIRASVEDYLVSLPPREAISTLIAGLHKDLLLRFRREPGLRELTVASKPFYLDPIPSMYFTRDHGAMIGDGLFISQMFNFARRRETLFLRYLAAYHPIFRNSGTGLWFSEELPTGIEGGDIIVLAPHTLAIGFSERTTEAAIEYVARGLLMRNPLLRQVLVIEIPAQRAYMHLDTVLTMVDRDKFLLYPGIHHQIRTYRLTLGNDSCLRARAEEGLEQSLESVLGLRHVEIIHSGGDNAITSAREQWSDSTNTLALGPGVVVTYDRNEVTNRILRKHGIEVIEIEGSELVRGRGGPRCMSLPLLREDLV